MYHFVSTMYPTAAITNCYVSRIRSSKSEHNTIVGTSDLKAIVKTLDLAESWKNTIGANVASYKFPFYKRILMIMIIYIA